MSVGNQQTKAGMDNALSSFTQQLSAICQQIRDLNTQVNGTGAGAAYLANLGYTTTANPDNPGSQSDQAWALQALAYLNNMSGVWFGTAEVTPPFSFDNALAQLRTV
jgi:hypothetical protein